MNTRFSTIARATLSALALFTPALGHAANVGYFEMCGGSQPAHAAAITTAGHTPVLVATPDAASLVGLAALSVTNCDNSGYSATYTSNLAAITNAVNGGMRLVLHDRYVSGAASVLPGGAGLSIVRDFSDDRNIEIPAGSPILSGPGGTLTNTSLDNGNSSSHGYVTTASLPAGAQTIATQGDPTRAVTVAYIYGAGSVTYSTIPLDYYFNGSSPAAFKDIYAPNILANMPSFTTCANEGFTGIKLTLCRQICEMSQSPARLSALIKTYVTIYREDPPCAR